MDKSSSLKKAKITPKLVLESNKQSTDMVMAADVTDVGTVIPPSPHDSSEEIADFDDLIHHFGDCGRYQMLLFFLMIPFICFLAFIFYTQMLITLVPMHWCKVPELESLSLHER